MASSSNRTPLKTSIDTSHSLSNNNRAFHLPPPTLSTSSSSSSSCVSSSSASASSSSRHSHHTHTYPHSNAPYIVDSPLGSHRVILPHDPFATAPLPSPSSPTSSNLTKATCASVSSISSPAASSSSSSSSSSASSSSSCQQSSLSRWEMASFSVGHVLNDLTASCWFTYLLVMLQNARNLSPSQAGAVLLAGQIADAIATPLVGIYSDKSKGCQGCNIYLGRRKLWYTLGTVLVVICYFLLFGYCFPCDAPGTDSTAFRLIYFSAAASLFNVGWAAVQVSHMSMVPELSRVETVRVGLNAWRYSFTVIANIVVFFILFLCINVFQFGDETQFNALAYASLVIGGVTTFMFLVGTPEHQRDNPNTCTVRTVRRSKREDSSTSSQHSRNNSLRGSVSRPSSHSSVSTDAFNNSVTSSNNTMDSLAQPLLFTQASDDNTINITDNNDSLQPTPSRASSSRATSSSSLYPSLSQPLKPSILQQQLSINNPPSSSSSSSSSTSPRQPSISTSFATSPPTTSHSSIVLSKEAKTRARGGKFKAHWSHWFRVRNFYFVGIVYMCTRLTVNVSQVFLPFYITDTLDMPQMYITIIPCILYISSFISSIMMKKLNKWVGRKNVYIIGSVTTIVSMVVMYLLPSHSSTSYLSAFVVASLLLGVGNASLMVSSVQLCADLVQSDNKTSGFVYGIFSFADKFANGIAIYLLQLYNDQSPTFVRVAETSIPFAASVISTALLPFILIEVMEDNDDDEEEEEDSSRSEEHGEEEEEPQHALTNDEVKGADGGVEDDNDEMMKGESRRRSSTDPPLHQNKLVNDDRL